MTRIGLLALIGAMILGCGGGDTEVDDAVVVSVKTALAAREPIEETATAPGTVFPKQKAVISAKVAGQLKAGLLQNQAVEAGQVLATLDAVDAVQAQRDLRQAEGAASHAQAVVDRRRTLFDQGGLSKKDLEESELELSNAQADLTAARHSVSSLSAEIRAPFAGVISQQMQFDGEFVADGTPLFELVDLSELVVKARVPDTVGSHVVEGSEATVEDEAFVGQPVTGTVTMVSQTTDAETRTQEVWVRVADAQGRLRSGDAVQLTLTVGSHDDALVVPSEAVQLEASNGDDGTVMVVDDESIAHETPVKVGLHSGDRVEIVEGLEAGARVVTEGNYALPDQTKVQAAEPAPTDTP